ncbi:MAG: SPOR domain-containing protein [Acidobacteriota bacterium]|nr:SPOR domain-containing protein [Acidobacteriota bacterium]
MTEWNDEPGGNRDPYSEPESGTGKMLFYFFGVVVLCAVALAIGYTMGKRSVPPVTAETGAPAVTVAGNGASKPGAARTQDTAPADTAGSTAPDMPKDSTPAGGTKAKEAAKPAASSVTSAASSATTSALKPMPEMTGATGKGFMVQVAAVSRQDDAEALASALRKKQYPVLVMPGTGTDKLLHVQVGPFAELKDAEAMKVKLAADGYNAIVKK